MSDDDIEGRPLTVLTKGQNVQRKSTIGKPGPPIDEKRERMRHVQVEEEKEKVITEYMCYRRQQLLKKQIEWIFRKMKEDNYPGAKSKTQRMIHQFKDMEEFNKEEVYKLTTTAINKTFHVEGYKLARYKGKLVGKPAQKTRPPSLPPLPPPIPIVETKDDELDEMILKRLEVIEAKLKTVTDEILKYEEVDQATDRYYRPRLGRYF